MDKILKCKYAWGHLDFLQGQYGPCFRYKVNKQPIAKISDKLPSEVINSEEMQSVRRSLQQGVFPPGCFDCALKESRGLKSYRQQVTEHRWDDEDKINYNSVVVDRILDLELKFSRTCNFLCRHCYSESNNMFELIGKKHPDIHDKLLAQGFDQFGIADSPIIEVSEEVITDLVKNIIPNCKHIGFSGGEPLYHLQHYQFLEKLINSPYVDTKSISLFYNTNLSMIQFKDYDLQNLWDKFKSIYIVVSLDGTGDLFNYFRERGDYDTVINNIESLAAKSTNIIHFTFVCTSTAYHAFYADVIFRDLTALAERIQRVYNIECLTKPTFVHTANIDMVDLEVETKQFIIKNLEKTLPSGNNMYDYALTEIITHLKGDKRNFNGDFKEIVKIQDKIYNRDAFIMAPRVANYVYNNVLMWD
jgi:sulfatase maturation enzyme AslB (radical SAM superfamily)